MEKAGGKPGVRCLAVDRTERRHVIPTRLGIGSLEDQRRQSRGRVEPEESS